MKMKCFHCEQPLEMGDEVVPVYVVRLISEPNDMHSTPRWTHVRHLAYAGRID